MNNFVPKELQVRTEILVQKAVERPVPKVIQIQVNLAQERTPADEMNDFQRYTFYKEDQKYSVYRERDAARNVKIPKMDQGRIEMFAIIVRLCKILECQKKVWSFSSSFVTLRNIEKCDKELRSVLRNIFREEGLDDCLNELSVFKVKSTMTPEERQGQTHQKVEFDAKWKRLKDLIAQDLTAQDV